MKLSVVIPAYNEENNIKKTVELIYNTLEKNEIDHEIIVVNDNSSDNTEKVLLYLEKTIPSLKHVNNTGFNGYGYACIKGLENFTGDCVVITMADLSDDPKDIVKFYQTMLLKKVDMVFGNRWSVNSKVVNYPRNKLWINRLVNNVINVIFCAHYSDFTNGFKLYKKETIEGLKPFLTGQFSFALELPLKAFIRGYTFDVVPNNWYNREQGKSNLKIRKMFNRYAFVVAYCLIERLFSMGDYKKNRVNLKR